MTEYEKLTVAKLREELVKRGLPKAGLKAVLIQRLVEADGQSAQAEPAPNEAKTASPEKDDVKEASAISPRDSSDQQVASPVVPTIEKNKAETRIPPAEIPEVDGPISIEPETNREAAPEPAATATEVEDSPTIGSPKESRLEGADIPVVEEQPNESVLTATLNGKGTQAEFEAALPVAVVTSIAQMPSVEEEVRTVSRSESGTGEEMITDIKKRKRRSLTPTPSDESIQKKAKLSDGGSHVILPEDESMSDGNALPTTDLPTAGTVESQEPNEVEDTAMEDATPHEEVETSCMTDKSAHTAESKPSTDDAAIDTIEPPEVTEDTAGPQTPRRGAPEIVNGSSTIPPESPAKTSSPDARFKNLLPNPTRKDSSPTRPPSKVDMDDRVVSPALHPATTALYIRDILRPLHIDHLKDHLISLATPSNTSPDRAVVADFFLDSIRTHCLVRFTSVTAASRVRTGLHDRVWPDEKNRKPLWVDFVPEEKLPQWFEVENASNGRGQTAKRYEVVYENEGDGVKAYLQLVGSNNGGLRSSQVPGPRNGSRTGVRGAPSGPRVREGDQSTSQSKPRPDQGRGFQALDDLFKSTTAKPKLYYLPVLTRTAGKRLDMLAEGRGGGRGDEMRRYTFEEGLLVDRGPEFGSRGRGGYGGRGGSYRGYLDRGRGGYHRNSRR
ncbi:MAG: hypothetical protein Q9166_007626 [cf. Caloplaca sp. 2 TL-2023]